MIFKDKVCRTVQMHGYINNVLKFILTSYPIDSVLFMVRQYAPEFPFHNYWIRKLSTTGIFSTDLYLFILLNYWQLYTWYCFFFQEVTRVRWLSKIRQEDYMCSSSKTKQKNLSGWQLYNHFVRASNLKNHFVRAPNLKKRLDKHMKQLGIVKQKCWHLYL